MLRWLVLIVAVAWSPLLWAQDIPPEILLWPNGAPGSDGQTAPEKVRIATGNEQVVSTVHKPSLTPYLPTGDNVSGVAVIVAPGGGHKELWMTHEGHNAAKKLQQAGIAAFVLKYRLAEETGSPYKLEEHSLADMQRAIRLVRSRAEEWKINPAKVGAMGFSAGGQLAAFVAMKNDAGQPDAADPIDKQGCRPDFQALIYPGRTALYEVKADSPPAFLCAGYGDRLDISQGLAELYLKYKGAGVPAELHMYSNVGHGFGVRDRNPNYVGQWTDRFVDWIKYGQPRPAGARRGG